MIRPDRPASAAVSDDALFRPEAADYARYRPGLTAALRLLQDHADGGGLQEVAVFTVLLARRPGGAA